MGNRSYRCDVNDTNTGDGVHVYVIDTGVDMDHPDLQVSEFSVDCTNSSGGPPWSRTYTCESGGDDDNGHGTHVAGTVAAIDNDIDVVGVHSGRQRQPGYTLRESMDALAHWRAETELGCEFDGNCHHIPFKIDEIELPAAGRSPFRVASAEQIRCGPNKRLEEIERELAEVDLLPPRQSRR